MKEFYLVVSHSGSWLSHAIRLFTREPYSHVSIALNLELNELYSFGRLNPHNPFIGGFTIESIHEGCFKRFKETSCRIYRVPINNHSYELLQKNINNFIHNKEVYRYNFMGLLTFLFHYPLERKNAYFCSQFVATILKKSDILSFDFNPALFKPMDFTLIDGIELIYEGRIHDFCQVRAQQKMSFKI